MQTKIKWYRLFIPEKPERWSRVLASFSDGLSSGRGQFMPNGQDGGVQHFRFRWTSDVPVESLSSAGEPILVKVKKVDAVDFSLADHDGFTLMRVANAPRSLSLLLNGLGDAFGLGFESSTITYEKRMPLGVLAEVDESRLTGAKLKNVVMGQDAVGRIEIASKRGLRLSDLAPISGIYYQVDTLSYEVLYRSVRGQLSVTAGGLVKIGGRLMPLLIDRVEKEVVEIAAIR